MLTACNFIDLNIKSCACQAHRKYSQYVVISFVMIHHNNKKSIILLYGVMKHLERGQKLQKQFNHFVKYENNCEKGLLFKCHCNEFQDDKPYYVQ